MRRKVQRYPPLPGRIQIKAMTIYPDCKHCNKFIWWHVRQRCMYTLGSVYEPAHYGLGLLHGASHKMLWDVNSKTWRTVLTDPRIPEEVLWAHYLIIKGWRSMV